MENIVREYFSDIHVKSAEPLFVRLEKALERYVRTLPNQTLLPAERELAAGLGVNRKTLSKAMEGLASSGLLQRTRQGTVVRHGGNEKPFSLADVHPFVLNLVERKNTLRVLLCDNLPTQITFWQEAAADFTTRTGVDIEYEWLPRNCTTAKEQLAYLRQGGFQLAQFPSYAYLLDAELRGALAPLPDEITALAENPDYRFEEYLGDQKEIFGKLMPVYFSFHMHWVNPALAQRYKIDLDSYLNGNCSRLDLFNDADRKLPDSVFTLDYASSLPHGIEHPKEINRESIRNYYHKYLSEFARVENYRQHSFLQPLEERYIMCKENIVRAFQEDNLFMMNGFSLIMNYVKPQVSPPPLEVMVSNPFPSNLRMPFVGMGALREGGYTPETARFLRHLLKPEIQRRMVRQLLVAPMWRDADAELTGRFSGTTGEIRAIINNYRMMRLPDASARWYIQPQILLLLQGKICLTEAVKQAVDHFFRNP